MINESHGSSCARVQSSPLTFSVCALAGAVQHGVMPLTVADYPLYPFTANAVNGNKQWSGSVDLRVESFHNAFGSLCCFDASMSTPDKNPYLNYYADGSWWWGRWCWCWCWCPSCRCSSHQGYWFSCACRRPIWRNKNTKSMHMCMYVTLKYSQIHADTQSDTYRYAVRYSQKRTDLQCFQKCICACIQQQNKVTHIQICTALRNAYVHVSACMSAEYSTHTGTYALDTVRFSRRNVQIQCNTCRYEAVHITYALCCVYAKWTLLYLVYM